MPAENEDVVNREQRAVIDDYIKSLSIFIQDVKEVIAKTEDIYEKSKRNRTISLLLKSSTFLPTPEFEQKLVTFLPQTQDTVLSKISEKLMEINRFCQDAFSDDHELYQDIIKSGDANGSRNLKFIKSVLKAEITNTITESDDNTSLRNRTSLR